MDSTETTAAGPDAGSAPVVPTDPRPPARDRRAFLTEIAIVVIGVLLALGAEQVVQCWNWQSDVKETRKAIDKEISYNLASRKLRHDQEACIDRRLDELQRWHDSWVEGRPLKPTTAISRFNERTILFDAWNVAQTGQVAAHIPLEDRIRYATLYGFFHTYAEKQETEVAYWEELQKFDGARELTPRDLMELQGLVINLRQLAEFRKINWPIFERASREFRIPIGAYDLTTPAKSLCVPLFGSAGATGAAAQP